MRVDTTACRPRSEGQMVGADDHGKMLPNAKPLLEGRSTIDGGRHIVM